MRAKTIYVKSVLTIILPFILIFAFIYELCRGVRSACRYAWQEILITIDDYRANMKREDF